MKLAAVILFAACVACRAADVSLIWEPSTSHTDGTPVTNLQITYVVGVGSNSGAYPQLIPVVTTGAVVSVPGGVIEWTGSNLVVTLKPTTWGLDWDALRTTSKPAYFAVKARDSIGRESDWSQELMWTGPTNQITRIDLEYGTTMSGLNQVISVASTATGYVGNVTDINRTTVYMRPVAITAGGRVPYGRIAAIQNSKLLPPMKLMVTP